VTTGRVRRARGFALAALVGAGALTAARLPVDARAGGGTAEIAVTLRAPASDAGEVARWLEPLEERLRGFGPVESVRGEVTGSGAELRLRLRGGTDPARVAARLDTELRQFGRAGTRLAPTSDLGRAGAGFPSSSGVGARTRLAAPSGLGAGLDPARAEVFASGAELRVRSADSAADGEPAVVWLPGVAPPAAREVVRRLEGTRGVAAVEALGLPRVDVAVEVSPAARLGEPAVAGIEAALVRAAGTGAFGMFGTSRSFGGDGRRLPVTRAAVLTSSGAADATGTDAASLAELTAAVAALPVPLGDRDLPLRSIARVSAGPAPLDGAALRNGRPSIAVLVHADTGAPALAIERGVRGAIAGVPAARLEWPAAAALRGLLLRLALALLATSLLAAAIGARRAGWRAGLALATAPPAMAAAIAIAWSLAGTTVGPPNLVAGWLAMAAALPLAVRAALPGRSRGASSRAPAAGAGSQSRHEPPPRVARDARSGIGAAIAGMLLAASAVLLGAALAPPASAAALVAPARAFALALVAAAAAVGLVPAFDARTQGRGAGRLTRTALREAGTTVLLAASAAAVLGFGWGAAFLPRIAGRAGGGAADLTVRLAVPAEATVAETLPRAAAVERDLRRLDGVETTWAFVRSGEAIVHARLVSRSLRPDRLRRLLRLARARLGAAGSVEAPALGGGEGAGVGGAGASSADELRPEADEEGRRYRLLLRGRDLAALEAAYDRLRERLAKLQVRASWIEGWEPPALRLRLVPRPGANAARVAEAQRALARRAATPFSIRAPGFEERSVRLFLPETPRTAAALPQVATLLRLPLPTTTDATAPASLFAVEEERVRERVRRQDGRFVVPVELRLPYESERLRLDVRRRWDFALAVMPLPAGVELARPALGPIAVRWHPEQARLAAFAASLPLLLALLAAVRTGSGARALAAIAAPALGALAAAPLVASAGGLDESALLALLCAVAAALGATLAWGADLPAGPAWRVLGALRRGAGWAAPAALLATFALVAPTLGARGGRIPWVAPLRLAAVASGVAQGAALLLLPALLVGAGAWRRQRSAAARAERRPEAWVAPAVPRLEARSLVKRYPVAGGGRGRRGARGAEVLALDRVGFTLEPGIVGLLGPNGAGKTTLLRILTGILAPTRGGVRFTGVPVKVANLAAYRRQIGFLPQGFGAYPGFTAQQFLDYWARERGMRDPGERRREIARLLEVVGLSEHAARRVRDFSGGMRQRVGIARALLGAPAVLVVDEPTTGLDLEARRRFREALKAIAADRIIIFSTHIASDVEAVAGRLLLLSGGRLRFDGAPVELLARARGRVFEALVGDEELVELGHRYRVTSRVREVAGVRVRAVVPRGGDLPGAAVEPNLEEAYLAELS
jgi:ABC-type multidrug transport system ATPase subunit